MFWTLYFLIGVAFMFLGAALVGLIVGLRERRTSRRMQRYFNARHRGDR